jgi:putative aldouronate transport system permease protein
MLMTVLAAYPLSKTKRQFSARQFYVWYFMIAMMVSGGLIPNYLLISSLGLLDSVWALVLPSAVNVFNIILLMNYMKSLPDEIMESAFVDGAGHFKVLFRIVLPLCKPVLATLVLFIAVAHWNSWFDGLIYMNRVQNYPLQSYLQTIVVDINMDLVQNVDDLLLNVTQKSSKSAQIFLAMLPILCVYPFLQKYFTSGIVMGSVKG